MTEKNSHKPATSEPSDARIQKRRASQAKHRLNLATSFKNLHRVLPEEDITKLRSSGQKRPDILQDAFSGIKTNRTMLLSRAKGYVLHLESVVAMMLSEKREKYSYISGLSGSPYQQSTHSKISQFNSIKDIRRNFVRNFKLDKPILDFDFANKEESKEDESSNSTENDDVDILTFSPDHCSILNTALKSDTTLMDPNAVLLIPINVEPASDSSMFVNANMPQATHSPTNHSVDLGFVSASQESTDASSLLSLI